MTLSPRSSRATAGCCHAAERPRSAASAEITTHQWLFHGVCTTAVQPVHCSVLIGRNAPHLIRRGSPAAVGPVWTNRTLGTRAAARAPVAARQWSRARRKYREEGERG